MPKNKGKGGKNRRRGKNENDDIKRELILKEEGQSYAQVTRILGNGHLEAFCFDSAGGKNAYVIFVVNYERNNGSIKEMLFLLDYEIIKMIKLMLL